MEYHIIMCPHNITFNLTVIVFEVLLLILLFLLKLIETVDDDFGILAGATWPHPHMMICPLYSEW